MQPPQRRVSVALSCVVTCHDSLSKIILRGSMEGGRHRGQQRKCWMDNVKEQRHTTSKSGHPCPCQNCSQWPPTEKKKRKKGKDLCWLVPPTTHSVKGLNWPELLCLMRTFLLLKPASLLYETEDILSLVSADSLHTTSAPHLPFGEQKPNDRLFRCCLNAKDVAIIRWRRHGNRTESTLYRSCFGLSMTGS